MNFKKGKTTLTGLSILTAAVMGSMAFSSCGGSPSQTAAPNSPVSGQSQAASTNAGGESKAPTVTIPAPHPSSATSQGAQQSPSTISGGQYTASLIFSTSSVKTGDTVSVDVQIDSPVPTRGMQCALNFDPKVMKCENVTEGPYYKNWATDNNGTTIIFPQPKIDNGNGTADMDVAVMGGKEGGPTGTGIFCTYKFTALAAGTGLATLSDVLVADPTGKMVQSVTK